MSDTGPGCRKVGLMGCLGAFALLALAVGISAFWAWTLRRNPSVEDAELEAPAGAAAVDTTTPETMPAVGRLVLDIAHGGLTVHPAAPGEPTEIRARYDAKVYALEESLDHDDGTFWIYTVRFHRTAPFLVSLFDRLMGGEEAVIDVAISPDEPIELELHLEQAGMEADIGGLWITRLAADARQAGGSLSIGEPMRTPMDSLAVRSNMGGFELQQLANASPRAISLRCRMGGVELDLDGVWTHDVDLDVDLTMGGVDVRLPEDVTVEGLEAARSSGRLRTDRAEVGALPVMRFDVRARMGGVDVR